LDGQPWMGLIHRVQVPVQVPVPASLMAVCDSLISVAVAGSYAPKWRARIEQEWMRALAEKNHRATDAYSVRREAMRQAVPDWEVAANAWQPLAHALVLPDPNDVHVLTAAIAGHADCIVTSNLKDFPLDALEPFGLQAIHPDDFLLAQIDLNPLDVLAAFAAQRARLPRPAFTPEVFADALERNALVLTAQRL
jgi:predicted nucleic acid-binding protein